MHSSGDKESIGGITKRGNKNLKKCLVESAWMAIRSDTALMMNYKEYCKRMEPSKALLRALFFYLHFKMIIVYLR